MLNHALSDGLAGNRNPNLQLRPPFRECWSHLRPVLLTEVRRAVHQVSSGKASGRDGFPTDLSKNLPSLYPYLSGPLNAIYQTGRIPEQLRTRHIVPSPEPGTDPRNLASKHPISLLCSLMGSLECVICNRVLPQVDPRLYEEQFAYMRSRITERDLTILTNSAQRALFLGRPVYIVSFDVAGAYDGVSHYQLVGTLTKMGLGVHTRWITQNWLRRRSFILRFCTPDGYFFGESQRVSAGLPKGGCLITTDVAQNPVMQRQGAHLPPDELHGSNVRGCCNGSNNGCRSADHWQIRDAVGPRGVEGAGTSFPFAAGGAKSKYPTTPLDTV